MNERRPTAAEDEPRRTARPRLIIAEDDEDIRSVFAMILADQYEIRGAASAAETLAIARAWAPDVVLLDWTLPDASGEEVATRLREMKASFANLPIVVVSGAPTVKALAAAVGAVPCPKPCDVDQLLAAIECALMTARRD